MKQVKHLIDLQIIFIFLKKYLMPLLFDYFLVFENRFQITNLLLNTGRKSYFFSKFGIKLSGKTFN